MRSENRRIPFKQLRDFCREELDCAFSEKRVIEHFGSNLTSELLRKRLIESIKDRKDEYKYRLTRPGRRLAGKSLLTRITLAKARMVISGLRKRARAINT